jgi:pyruvate dehydrogenase E1 component alpha subunit
MKKKEQAASPPLNVILDMYRTMTVIRHFEGTVRKLHLAGKAPGLVHLSTGQEAMAAGVCLALNQDDYVASHHRGHGHCVAKGASLERLFAELTGRRDGYGMGRGGSMHIYDPENNNLGTNGIVGGSVPLATGAALSAKLRSSRQVAISFFGDGVLNQGLLFESMNMAAVWALPVVYICEDNRYGEFTETSTVTAGKQYIDRGVTFDIPSSEVDGMDVLAVYDAVIGAVCLAREGGGPSFLVCETARYTGHHVSDKQEYKDEEELEAWNQRDPIQKLARWLIANKHATRKSLDAIDEQASKVIGEAADAAAQMAAPEASDLWKHVYATTT